MCCETLASAQGKQFAQASIAQEKPSPEQRAHDDWKQAWKQAVLDAHVGSDGATQIAGQQDRAEN
jgi:hypothetical protein